MINSSSKSYIAITADHQILRCRLLIKLIELCGAVPKLIPFTIQNPLLTSKSQNLREKFIQEHLQKVQEELSLCSALILPGNKHDVPPHAYGQSIIHPQTAKRIPKSLCYARFETESFMAQYALAHNWPILGICGGMHVFNVTLGGTLVQHLPDDPRIQNSRMDHRDPSLKALSLKKQLNWEKQFEDHIHTGSPVNIYPKSHAIRITPNSLLSDIYLKKGPNTHLDKIYELSIHHQGAFEENLAPQLQAVAHAEDGLVEAAELKAYTNFFLLTQFHFECNVSKMALPLVQRLVDSIKPMLK